MQRLKDVFYQSSKWMKRYARPLECARWEYEFEGGSRETIIHFLRAFQNEDGGFGHGIEPDFWLPISSPMATWLAGQIMVDIDMERNHDLVQSMLTYLVRSYDEEVGFWRSVLQENNDYPHAPWWNWKEGVQGNWMYNPSAELAGFLIHWSEEGSEAEQLGWKVAIRAIDHLMVQDEMEHHQLSNFHELIKLIKKQQEVDFKLSHSLSSIKGKVMTLIEHCVDRDVENWGTGYKPLPLDFIKSPNDPLCTRFGQLAEQNLQFYVEQLSEDGMWEPSWSWGSYPHAFPVAKRDWQGILLVNRYKVLKAFGWIS
ncbi:hypothetical protein [Halalkalibacter hemicellulosilyticus]|uniref:Uncharacterized protein n=1 Tax=Halalkalibacter hemicellulosilyticusJCM 9152 TaxID=1236971 RepID=W4QEL8_9BACI|nr:hypothetical protein [Halalkalibacter hemicellulosilyticus]GAE30491.1 hypothetical protein JCM9152_1899 [Halalkalibacter hemicellulosilyticusJCM 9152]